LSGKVYEELTKDLENEKTVDPPMVISFYCGGVKSPGAPRFDAEEDCEKYLKQLPLQG
jgi:hypothetical protein